VGQARKPAASCRSIRAMSFASTASISRASSASAAIVLLPLGADPAGKPWGRYKDTYRAMVLPYIVPIV
jgi:hypothetical protein